VSEQPKPEDKLERKGSTAAGFYHDPPLWVGTAPVDFSAQLPIVDALQLRKPAFRRVLDNGVEIKATVEGLFAFDFRHWPQAALIPSPPDQTKPFENMPSFDELAAVVLERTSIMNAFLAFMYTKELRAANFARKIMIVTPELIVSMKDIDTISGFGSSRVSQLYLLASQAQGSVDTQYLYFDERVSGRYGIATEVVAAAADDLATLMKVYPEDGVLIADLMLRAGKSGQDHNYSAALIAYWAIIEKMLQELWQKYQADNRKRDAKPFVTSARMKKLEGRNYTASVISEILSLVGYLETELYRQVDYVRSKRNDWIHKLGGKISNEDAAKAGEVASKLLEDVRGIHLARTMWGSIQIHL
jgi:hypothetical protein